MYRVVLRVMVLMAFFAVSACSSKFADYDGPQVTRILVLKEKRRMYLMNGKRVLKAYDFDLGFAPEGDKLFEGDGRTPEGRYYIDRRNPNSSFYLSIGINYPNARDRAEARKLGKSPGGDIFIHGQPNLNPAKRRGPDWTAGCIAVTNKEMREIYAMVNNGTAIDIMP
ncbi:MAG: L,D-transpeptidase family protein [Pseudomonadota bacterium]